MIRPDLSKWEIWHAADALLAADIKEPASEQVVARLGRYTPDMIEPAMKEWRERRAGVAGAGLPDALSALVLALYQEQTATAVRLIDECRTEAEENLSVVQRHADDLSAKLEKMTTNLRSALTATDQLRTELRQQQDQVIRLQAQSVSMATENQRLSDELSSLREKNAALRDQLDDARAETGAIRTTLAHEKLAGRTHSRELKAQRLALVDLEATLQDTQAESNAVRTDLQLLRAERDVLQQRIELAEGRADNAEAQVNAAQQRAVQLHTRIDQLRLQEDQKTDERIQKLSKLLLAGSAVKRTDGNSG